jgi:hypothetical protein
MMPGSPASPEAGFFIVASVARPWMNVGWRMLWTPCECMAPDLVFAILLLHPTEATKTIPMVVGTATVGGQNVRMLIPPSLTVTVILSKLDALSRCVARIRSKTPTSVDTLINDYD